MRVVHVRTDYNVADFFTKGLTIAKFSNFRNLLMGEQKSHIKTPTTAAPTGIHDKGKIRTVARGFDETMVAPGSDQAKHPMWGIVKTAATPISPSPSPERTPSTSANRKRRSTSTDDPHHCLNNNINDIACIDDRIRIPCPSRMNAYDCLREVTLQRLPDGPRDNGERSESQCCMWSSIANGIDSEDAVLRSTQRRRFVAREAWEFRSNY